MSTFEASKFYYLVSCKYFKAHQSYEFRQRDVSCNKIFLCMYFVSCAIGNNNVK